MKTILKILLPAGVCLAAAMVMGAMGVLPAAAMKVLSNDDLGGVAGMAGLSIYGRDLDMTVGQFDKFHLYLSSPTEDVTSSFLIVPKTASETLFPEYIVGHPLYDQALVDAHTGVAAAFSGSPTDPNVPVQFDAVGLDIDIHGGRNFTGVNEPRMTDNATTLSLAAYGSFELHWTWELVQFVAPGGDPPQPGEGQPYDVFGLHIGQWFWDGLYGDDYGEERPAFMRMLLSPLSNYTDAAFFDSTEGPWRGYSKAQIRSSQGIGGELGMKLGSDGDFSFRGFDQEARGDGLMFAGAILDQPYLDGGQWVYPNWKTQDRSSYYSIDINDWYIVGDFTVGVHHQREYDRWAGHPDHETYLQGRLGRTSDARPIRFEFATSTGGDSYMVAYIHGHYSRSVYYPDSRESSMGTSYGTIRAPLAENDPETMKHYVIGDFRIGDTYSDHPDTLYTGSVGSWVINDISMPYAKIVIPGERDLVYEISAGSEDFLIPNTDYYGFQMAFWGDFSPTTTNRRMRVAGTMNSDVNCYPNRTTPWVYNRGVHRIDAGQWNN